MAASIQAVLFDAVGTLIHPVPDVVDVYVAAGHRFGSRHAASAIHTRFREAFKTHDDAGKTNELREVTRWRRIVADVFDDVADEMDSLFQTLWVHFAQPQHWALYDDVLPVWNALREQGLTIGIASNFDSRLHGICQATKPLDQADHLFCSSVIGFPKPRPEFYQHITHKLQLDPRQILMIGDHRVNDVEAARAAGWHAAFVQREGVSADEPATSSFWHVIQAHL